MVWDGLLDGKDVSCAGINPQSATLWGARTGGIQGGNGGRGEFHLNFWRVFATQVGKGLEQVFRELLGGAFLI